MARVNWLIYLSTALTIGFAVVNLAIAFGINKGDRASNVVKRPLE
ncbi:hypothetical protein [Nostoc sp. CHAB 5836]|nr:hypothetical protein [Nostoc sp. CHAB 5836]